jgi:hypothetical protein
LQAGKEIFKYDPNCRCPEDLVISRGLYKKNERGKKE